MDQKAKELLKQIKNIMHTITTNTYKIQIDGQLKVAAKEFEYFTLSNKTGNHKLQMPMLNMALSEITDLTEDEDYKSDTYTASLLKYFANKRYQVELEGELQIIELAEKQAYYQKAFSEIVRGNESVKIHHYFINMPLDDEFMLEISADCEEAVRLEYERIFWQAIYSVELLGNYRKYIDISNRALNERYAKIDARLAALEQESPKLFVDNYDAEEETEKAKAPQIWDQLSKTHTIGVVNSIHSSDYKNTQSFSYLIPDPYAKKCHTKPKRFSRFQRFKIRNTFRSGRVSKFLLSPKNIVDFCCCLHFISVSTAKHLFATIINALLGRHKERLRNVDFLFHSDIFLSLLKQNNSQVNVLFTNHIASQMHRYLGAKFSDEEIISKYGTEWVGHHKNEVFHAITLLDQFIGRLLRQVDLNKDRIVMCSSMGQLPFSHKHAGHNQSIYIADANKFWSELLADRYAYQILGAMVPQLSLAFEQESIASSAEHYLKTLDIDGFSLYIERKQAILTVTFRAQKLSYNVNGRALSLKQLGGVLAAHDKANTGRHMPRGVLWVIGNNVHSGDYGLMSYLHYIHVVEQSLKMSRSINADTFVTVLQS